MNRKEYIESLKTQLDEWNAEIDKWESKVNEVQTSARKSYEDQLAEVRKYRDQLQGKLDEMREAGEERWTLLKEDADYVWHAFKSSVNYFKSHF